MLKGLLLHEHNNCGIHNMEIENTELVKPHKYVVIKGYHSPGHCNVKGKNQGPEIGTYSPVIKAGF